MTLEQLREEVIQPLRLKNADDFGSYGEGWRAALDEALMKIGAIHGEAVLRPEAAVEAAVNTAMDQGMSIFAVIQAVNEATVAWHLRHAGDDDGDYGASIKPADGE